MTTFKKTKKLVIRRRKDGLFFQAGHDCADRWVQHPEDADDRGDLLYLKDAFFSHNAMEDTFKDCDIVEVEKDWRMTGRTTEDLYSGGELITHRDKPFTVRITRSGDDDHADVPVWAETWEKAKEKAAKIVKADPRKWFGEVPTPTYYVSGMDDDEDAGEGHPS